MKSGIKGRFGCFPKVASPPLSLADILRLLGLDEVEVGSL